MQAPSTSQLLTLLHFRIWIVALFKFRTRLQGIHPHLWWEKRERIKISTWKARAYHHQNKGCRGLSRTSLPWGFQFYCRSKETYQHHDLESWKWRNGYCFHLRASHHEVRVHSGIHLEAQWTKDKKCSPLPYIQISISQCYTQQLEKLYNKELLMEEPKKHD